jgi:hypothetical protein
VEQVMRELGDRKDEDEVKEQFGKSDAVLMRRGAIAQQAGLVQGVIVRHVALAQFSEGWLKRSRCSSRTA